jgi:two-component system CheB/CheR fusion protein
MHKLSGPSSDGDNRDDAPVAGMAPSPPAAVGFAVVGIGASCGDLPALVLFLRQVPARTKTAFVIVQHPGATPDSLLAGLRGCVCAMPLDEAVDGTVVAPGRAYIVPPDREVVLVHGALRLSARRDQPGSLPLDVFLASLAEEWRQEAAAVLFSVPDRDGMLGLRAIKERGGLTAVQEPGASGSDGMFRSVIDAGLADLAEPAERLPATLLAMLRRRTRRPRAEIPVSDQDEALLARILHLLQEHTGHDFSFYKKTTLFRRIELRMGRRRIAMLAEYVDFLSRNPDESSLLLKELLIGVTRFFRDPEVWDHLRGAVIPGLLATRPAGTTLRAWTVGCASGEEAYSLAMVFHEARAQAGLQNDHLLQIFATDLDQAAIDRARRGVYPSAIAATVSPERLRRYFVEEGGRYRINSEIREMVIFAPHSLLVDPPFTKLDILTCRNLMIYLGPEVHEALLPRFHFSLNPGGMLMLGSSESVGTATNLFHPLDGQGQLYRRLNVPLHPTQAGVTLGPPPTLLAPANRRIRPMTAKVIANLQALADQLLLQRYAPAAVLVNSVGDIVHISGKTGKYLEPATGKANWNVLAMARDGLNSAVSEAFHEAQRLGSAVTLTAQRIGDDGATRSVDITAQPISEPPALQGMLMIVFADATAPSVAPALDTSDRTARQSARLKSMEQALQATREELQATREEMQTSREELTSTNEELQSTNEELTTSAEELRSMNDELLRARSAAELGLARYTDLFDSAPVGYFTLERNGVISQSNLAGADLLGLGRHGSVGGRLALFVIEADRPTFACCIEQAFTSREAQQCEVSLWRDAAVPRRVRISALAVEDDRICRVVAVDVTEIREAESALRESEERFRNVADHAPVLIWMSGPDKLCTHFNQAWLTFTGRTLEQEMGNGWAESVHPDDLERCLAVYCSSFDARQKFSMEYRLRRHDGEFRCMLDIGVPRFAADGGFLGYIGSCVDITERMLAEAAMKESEERYRLLWETTTDAVVVFDDRNIIRYANPAVESVFGHEPQAIIGQPMDVLQPERLRRPHREGVARYLATGVKKLDWRASQAIGVHRDGHEIPIEIAFSHVVIGGRHLFAGFLRDITDRVRSEAALRESEERFRRIVETANEGIWIIDAQGLTSFVNPKMAQMLGHAPEDIHGHPLSDFMDSEDRAALEHRLQGGTGQADLRFRRKDGSDLWALMATNPIDDASGACVGTMALVTDITERKRLEDELRHAQKMEAVGRLAGGVAHDFNNQLTVIQGYGALALSRTTDPALAKCLTQIVNASKRSADLVRQLMTFSRKGRHNIAPVDVHGLIDETLDVLGRSLNKLIRLQRVLQATDAIVQGDAGLLQNALLNLALNARDAMPDGGELRFATTTIELDAARSARLGEGVKPGPYLQIAVSDTGQGMSEEVQKHLFEPFFSTKAPGQGTGLGLASVYGTITQHGGGIEVDSSVGRGSTFRVYLPLAGDPAARPAAGSRQEPITTASVGACVLVIDDEEFVAALVADTLTGLGYEVVCRHDGATALEHYRAHWQTIDLVILDMNMPTMSGPETYAAMRAINPQVRVLIISGYSEEGGVEELIRRGAEEFLAKPFRPELLAQQVAHILQRRGKRPG